MIESLMFKIKFVLIMFMAFFQQVNAEVIHFETKSMAGAPTLDVILDDDYLIMYALSKSKASGQFSEDVVKFQNYAWDLNQPLYRDIRKVKRNVFELVGAAKEEKFKNFIQVLIQSEEYRTIRNQTISYIESAIKEWNNNLETSSIFVTRYSGFNLDRKVTVFITHPAVGNGAIQDQNKSVIAFGAWPTFSNYFTVYVWHEILHTYMNFDDVSHAVNQLLTDNDLRVYLNNDNLYPLVGHDFLKKIMDDLMPQWIEYKKSPTDLNSFVKSESKFTK